MLNITIKDQKNLVTPEELAQAMKNAEPILKRAQTGEEKYADSQGWLDLEKWAGEDTLARIEEIAAEIQKNSDA